MLRFILAALRCVTILATEIPEDEQLADAGPSALYEALVLDPDQIEAIESLQLQIADEQFELAIQSIRTSWHTTRESASNVGYRF